MNLKKIFDSKYDLAYNGVYWTEIVYYSDGSKTIEYDGYEVDYDIFNTIMYSYYKGSTFSSLFGNPEKDDKFKRWCAENGDFVRSQIVEVAHNRTYKDMKFSYTV